MGDLELHSVPDRAGGIPYRSKRIHERQVGSRTGFATQYSEHSIGITWWPNKIVTVRPELRFDHSYDVPAFNNGTRQNQVVFATDFIIHF